MASRKHKSLKESEVTEEALHKERTIQFFRIEFFRIYRICRKLFLVVLKMKITKTSLQQIFIESVEYYF